VILVKRRNFVITTLLILLLFTISAQAVEMRGIRATPILTFDGTTAQCYGNCKGGTSTDTVDATITLYQGTTYLDSWSDSGKGSLSVSGEYKVQRGKTYKLVLSYSVNGVEKPSVTVTNTCR
jgi:hypothetical protein